MNFGPIHRAVPVSAVLLLVLGQFAVSIHACNLAQMPDQADMPMHSSAAMPGMTDCMKQMGSSSQPLLCMEHCEQAAQSSQTSFPQLPLPMVALLLATLSALFLAAPLLASASFPLGALIAISPPLRVQFQTFRN